MSVVAYFFLPVSPDKARFLTEEEALVAKARAVRQVGDVERVGGIVVKDIGATLADPKAWFTAVWVFPCSPLSRCSNCPDQHKVVLKG